MRTGSGPRAMNRPLLAVLVVLVLAAVWYASRDEPAGPPVAQTVASPGAPGPRQGALRTAGVPEHPPPPAEPGRVRLDDPPESRPEAADVWDPELREPLAIRVVDEGGKPIAGAEVGLRALRPEHTPGPYHLRHPGSALRRTGASGRVELVYPVWTHPGARTSEVTVEVRHPRFPGRCIDLAVEPGERRVVMRRSGVLSVSGWIDDRTDRVFAVIPHTGRRAALPLDHWQVGAQRPPSTHRAPDEPFSLWLEHRDPEGRVWWSDHVVVATVRGEAHHEHLRLRPAVTVRGYLDSRVPRPVVDGVVEVSVPRGGNDARGIRRRVEVAADGSFEVGDLPRGHGEVVAACRGWRSPSAVGARARALAASGTRDGERPPPDWLRRAHNHVFDARAGDVRIVVPMQPEARAAVSVLRPDRQPLPDAVVRFWWVTRWASSSRIDLEVDGRATTDAQGIAVVGGLPDGEQGFVVRADGYLMPLRAGRIELTAGETHELAVVLLRARD